jgi:hypothetical protein
VRTEANRQNKRQKQFFSLEKQANKADDQEQ